MTILQAYTSQIVAMAMMALAIGSDQISTQARRETIISGLTNLSSTLIFALCSQAKGLF